MELNDRQIRRLEDGREYRGMKMAAKASDDAEEMVVEGYATTFDQSYILFDGNDYRVFEKIAPTAFSECDMSDVIMQYDHGGRVFARNKNGTLALTVDTVGLKVSANLGGTDIGRQLYQEIEGGYTDKMSFGFVVAEDKRESVFDRESGLEIITRTIIKISKLYDVSAVSTPANDMTSISARRFADGVIGEIKAERLERASKIKKLKLMLEV
ncbi:HK97 family phage prohead protease [Bittarella massiliensis (ex Durand et al. 2017)]|uniref:HK97 family phage prohead protease n=1 Tax=Bittarella massiliensis (ex Durand et al. 2017) TaxID=1720313 RepID=UPI00073E7D9A|nr:HK97 family phage prohead protease [Bittarella massiliensis (ex Durand et al. 2017)]